MVVKQQNLCLDLGIGVYLDFPWSLIVGLILPYSMTMWISFWFYELGCTVYFSPCEQIVTLTFPSLIVFIVIFSKSGSPLIIVMAILAGIIRKDASVCYTI